MTDTGAITQAIEALSVDICTNPKCSVGVCNQRRKALEDLKAFKEGVPKGIGDFIQKIDGVGLPPVLDTKVRYDIEKHLHDGIK